MKPTRCTSRPAMAALSCALAALLAGAPALAQDKPAKAKATTAVKPAAATTSKVDPAKCIAGTIATTGQLGELLLFRDSIPVRQLSDATAWITQCDVVLNTASPKDPGSCTHKEPLVGGKRLRISKADDGLALALIDGDGKVFRQGPATLGGSNPAAAGGKDAAWLTMTWQPGSEQEEHYFVMLLDYMSTGLADLRVIPKYYLVEVFNHADWNSPACRKEAPDNEANFKPYSGGSLVAPRAPRQTDSGSGNEPGRTP